MKVLQIQNCRIFKSPSDNLISIECEKPETLYQTMPFASKELWKKEYITGPIVAHYSFHTENFFFHVGREVARVEGGYQGRRDQWYWGA